LKINYNPITFTVLVRLIFYVLLTLLAAGAQGVELFSDMAEESGLDFVHFNGMSGEYLLSEIMGGGVALFDYDNDGDLDVYLTQGHMLGQGKTLENAFFQPRSGEPLRDRLYRNDLIINPNGSRKLKFVEVTDACGLDARGYGMGVAAGDFDGDGWIDLFVTNLKEGQLWRNSGEGTFADVTHKAGLMATGWAVSAAFLDYDRDGHLDLYVGNYVVFPPDKVEACYSPTSARDYCGPQVFPYLADRLFRNRGQGTFEDVSHDTGITHEFGPALGVVTADFNADSWVDIYVANDGEPNQLWLNQKNGTFKNMALLAGVAVNMEGAPEGSMGVDAADFDGDGDEDLFMTHWQDESNTLYINDGQGWFEDRSLATGLATPSKGFTGFGTGWFDYDNNGWLDLFVANGGVRTVPTLIRAGDIYPLHQTNQLFANLGNGRFKEITAQAGKVFELSEVSRGAAFGDVDNDGDTDIVVANNSGPVRLLVNNVGNKNHWLGLHLLNRSGQEALGARVELVRPDTAPLWRRVHTDGSYASSNDPRVLFGLGNSTNILGVHVYWPSGRVEAWKDIPIDHYTTLHEGGGKEIPKS
jgi:hypothetical protein